MNLRVIFKFIFLWVLFLSSQFGNDLSAQCNCSDSIRNLYKHAAAQAVIHGGIYYDQRGVLDSVLVSDDSIDQVLDKLCCIYNSSGPARDSVFNVPDFRFSHHPGYHELHTLSFFADTTNPILKNWVQGKNSTYPYCDNFINKYSFNIHIKLISIGSRAFYTGNLYTDKFLNKPNAVNHAPCGVKWDNSERGDGSDWFYVYRHDTTFFVFVYKWGDCPAGCTERRTWVIGVTNDGKVTTPIYHFLIPPYPLLNTVVLSDYNPDQAFCANTNPVCIYSKYAAPRYRNYLGGKYGSWYINDIQFGDTDVLKTDRFGTFILRHIPTDSFGIWLIDTVRVTKYDPHIRKNFIPSDTIETCKPFLTSLPKHFETSLRDSIAKKQLSFYYTFFEADTDSGYLSCLLTDPIMYCAEFDTVYVKEIKVPEIQISDSFNVKGGDSIILNAGTGWDSVFWNGVPHGRYFTYYGSKTGRFDTILVKAINSLGCERSKTIIVQNTGLASTQSQEYGSTIVVFPNPANDRIWLASEAQPSYFIFDPSGKLCMQGNYSPAGIPIQSLCPGLYQLAIVTAGENIAHAKFIVQKQ
jgi:hypothetical protein